jgi:hypothetical protein
MVNTKCRGLWKRTDVTYLDYFFFFFLPNAGHGLLILEVSRSYTTTHHSR